MRKTPEQIQLENEEVTDISLSLMEQLLEETKKGNKLLREMTKVLEDSAGLLTELVDLFDDGDEEET